LHRSKLNSLNTLGAFLVSIFLNNKYIRFQSNPTMKTIVDYFIIWSKRWTRFFTSINLWKDIESITSNINSWLTNRWWPTKLDLQKEIDRSWFRTVTKHCFMKWKNEFCSINNKYLLEIMKIRLYCIDSLSLENQRLQLKLNDMEQYLSQISVNSIIQRIDSPREICNFY
jgi:hypothetical protein